MWRSVISLKYGAEDGGWFSNIPKGSHDVGLWKEISKEIGQLKLSSSFELGDGRKVILGGCLVWCDFALFNLPLSLLLFFFDK